MSLSCLIMVGKAWQIQRGELFLVKHVSAFQVQPCPVEYTEYIRPLLLC